MLRDSLDKVAAEAMLSAQASRQERLARANDVIRNDGTVDELDVEVARLHPLYLELASASTPLR
jgi:dephospho-CoA kinase